MICFPSDKDNPSLYRVCDAPHTPDVYHTDVYASQHKRKGTTLVIDNGTNQTQSDTEHLSH